MELIKLVTEVQRLSNEAGLALNNSESDMVKVKLQLLLALLSEEVKFLVKVEPDEVEEPDELETPAISEHHLGDGEISGPEAQPSDE